MKKVILGTTALVAASALTAGSASAAEKIKLELGGYLTTSFVVADYDTDNNQLPTDLRHEGEVFFTGETTLDNGLTFGVNIQLEAYTASDQIDETFMYVEGNFGRVNIGAEDSAAYLMHYPAPSPVPDWGLASPNANASGFDGAITPSTLPNELGDTDKITYFTPRFSGFQFGASYTPDGDEETTTSGAPISAEGAKDEAYSLGVNFVQDFDGVNVAASLGYQRITTSLANTDDIDEYAAGINVGFAGFTIGGAYKFTDSDSTEGAGSPVDEDERQDWNLGVTYGQGPWKVGVQYAGITLEDDSASTDGEVHAFVVGGQYILGPGVTAFGGIQYWDHDDTDLAGSEGEDATIFFVGTALSF